MTDVKIFVVTPQKPERQNLKRLYKIPKMPYLAKFRINYI